METGLVFAIIAGGLFVYIIVLFNRVVSMRNLTKNAWSDVDVYLKKRAELIPNLVATVKAYADHESNLFAKVAELRGQAMASGTGVERADTEGKLGSQVQKLLMVAESYPELRASENFQQLQRDLTDTEDKLAKARQYYNACIRDLNILVESFPSSVVAGMMGQRTQPFFELESPVEAQVPRVGPSDFPQ
jgi:LemA protein